MGGVVQEAGMITYDMPWDEYRALDGISISSLKNMRRSPLHYMHAKVAGSPPNAAMNLGSATHVAVLEPDKFDAEHVVFTGERRAGKEWTAFREGAGSRRIITQAEHGLAVGMQAAVRACPDAMRYLRAGRAEVTLQWPTDHKGRIDWLTPDGIIVGLKTARDCRPHPFGSQSAKLGYHLQWAYYHDGYQALTGEDARVVEIVVESSPPHDVGVYVVPEDVLLQGREEYEALLKIRAECVATGRWPGAVQGEQILTLPTWAYNSSDDDDDSSDLGLEVTQ
jgi:exodeoxyribonuclease VIII